MTPQLLSREMCDLEQRAVAGADAEYSGEDLAVPMSAEHEARIERVHRIFAAAARGERAWYA